MLSEHKTTQLSIFGIRKKENVFWLTNQARNPLPIGLLTKLDTKLSHE